VLELVALDVVALAAAEDDAEDSGVE